MEELESFVVDSGIPSSVCMPRVVIMVSTSLKYNFINAFIKFLESLENQFGC